MTFRGVFSFCQQNFFILKYKLISFGTANKNDQHLRVWKYWPLSSASPMSLCFAKDPGLMSIFEYSNCSNATVCPLLALWTFTGVIWDLDKLWSHCRTLFLCWWQAVIVVFCAILYSSQTFIYYSAHSLYKWMRFALRVFCSLICHKMCTCDVEEEKIVFKSYDSLKCTSNVKGAKMSGSIKYSLHFLHCWVTIDLNAFVLALVAKSDTAEAGVVPRQIVGDTGQRY